MDLNNNHTGPKISPPKIPAIAEGREVPPLVEKLIAERDRAEKAERRATLLAWGGIATSFITMLIGYLLGKFC